MPDSALSSGRVFTAALGGRCQHLPQISWMQSQNTTWLKTVSKQGGQHRHLSPETPPGPGDLRMCRRKPFPKLERLTSRGLRVRTVRTMAAGEGQGAQWARRAPSSTSSRGGHCLLCGYTLVPSPCRCATHTSQAGEERTFWYSQGELPLEIAASGVSVKGF